MREYPRGTEDERKKIFHIFYILYDRPCLVENGDDRFLSR
jgi:hypothetical protein